MMATLGQSIKSRLRALPSLRGPFAETCWDAPPPTPQQAFQIWLDDAIANDVEEPHAMTLSTVDEHGCPDARVLILKNVDERGWHFAIKADSPKGRQIAANAQVALTIYWSQLGRQIRIRGTAVALSESECAADFKARPLGSKVSAIASQQSEVLHTSDELRDSLVDAQAFLDGQPDYVAPGWVVYAVLPNSAEFWQGATDRLHKRLRYSGMTQEGVWQTQNLWP